MPKRIAFLLAFLLPISPANAALLLFDDRDLWRQQAGGAADLSENFESVASDLIYFNGPATGPQTVGFMTFSVINGSGDNRWRVDTPNAAFLRYPAIDRSAFAILLSQNTSSSDSGDTRIDFDQPLRAIGFDYRRATESEISDDGIITTDRTGDAPVTIAKTPGLGNLGGVYFLGMLYTEGESINFLSLFSEGKFAMSIDNVEAFQALKSLPDGDSAGAPPLNPVPVPAAAWLFASALLGLMGFLRRTHRARS